MGNPPFVGKKEQSKIQKQEVIDVWGKSVKGVGNLDYVTCWYKKAADYMKETDINAAFVSTNSITQGEQVPTFGREFVSMGIHISFAYRTFRWDSEASLKAHVHCVIIGFSYRNIVPKRLFSAEMVQEVNEINPYLVNAPTVIIENNNKAICKDAPQIYYGSMPIDDGNLILSKEDVDNLMSESNDNRKFVRKYAGGTEIINNKDRWCLWLVGFSPKEIGKSDFIRDRIQKTADFRKSSFNI